MATKFYLKDTADTTFISPTPDSGWEDTSLLSRSILSTQTGSDTVTQRSFTDSNNADRDVLYRQYISPELAAGQTITGAQAIKAQCICSEVNSGNNLFFTVGIRIIASDGTTVRKTVLALTRDNTEAATSATNRQFTATSAATNYTTVAGDCIVVEIGLAGDPTGSNTHSSSMWLGNATGAASDLPEDDTGTTTSLRPWVQLNDTLNFVVSTSVAAASTTSASGTTQATANTSSSLASTATVTGADAATANLSTSISVADVLSAVAQSTVQFASTISNTSSVSAGSQATAQSLLSASAVSTVSPILTALANALSTISSSSSLSGVLEATANTLESVSVTTTVTGALDVESSSNMVTNISVTTVLSGASEAQGATIAALTSTSSLSTNLTANGQTVGTLTVTTLESGSLSATVSLAGSVINTSSISGSLAATSQLASSISSLVNLNGTGGLTAQAQSIGSLTSTTSASGNMIGAIQFLASSIVSSLVSAVAQARVNISSGQTATVTVTGDLSSIGGPGETVATIHVVTAISGVLETEIAYRQVFIAKNGNRRDFVAIGEGRVLDVKKSVRGRALNFNMPSVS